MEVEREKWELFDRRNKERGGGVKNRKGKRKT